MSTQARTIVKTIHGNTYWSCWSEEGAQSIDDAKRYLEGNISKLTHLSLRERDGTEVVIAGKCIESVSLQKREAAE